MDGPVSAAIKDNATKPTTPTAPPLATEPVEGVTPAPAPVYKIGDKVVLVGTIVNIDLAKDVAYVQHESGVGSAYELPLKELRAQ